jgi:DNA-binding CsgD family transcriptional regulator
MVSLQEYSGLLASLYAAPLQPEKWQEFFDHLSRLTKLSIGTLSAIDGERSPVVLAGGGFAFNLEAVRQYNEYYSELDPFAAPFFQVQQPAVLNGEQLLAHDRMVKTEFYDGLLSKNQMEFLTVMAIDHASAGKSFMTLWRRSNDGPMDTDSVMLLNMLLPHAQTALKMRGELRIARLHSQLNDLVLEGFGLAALVVSRNGAVLHMNSLAKRLIEDRDSLLIKQGVLSTMSSDSNQRLWRLIDKASKTEGTGGAMTISNSHRSQSLNMSVLPLPENSRASFAMRAVLILINTPSSCSLSRDGILRELYAFTPTEARLARLLINGYELKSAAEKMRITRETARFHMKRIFAKSGTHSQSELIRLMFLLPPMSPDSTRPTFGD